jgi:glycosyltransferase involved in cell wall biosynthesis
LRILIGGSSSKFFHLTEFSQTLSKFGIDTKLVFDTDVYDGFPSRKINHWFQSRDKFNKLVNDFKPDIILVDRQRHFGLAALKANIPLFIHLRGNYWAEMEMAKKTLYRSFPKTIVIKKWETIAEQNFNGASMILPICKYLEGIVKEHYPEKKTTIIYSGITADNWYPVKGMNLKHPCVGILQGAVIWEKTKELLTLPRVLESLPKVTFYWAGDGPYRNEILTVLKKYDNFVYLGPLSYPDKVREYLTEIDIYALISGLDMSPLTLQEAQLMKKPVIATSVGGVPELMVENETGFLVEKGDPKGWIEKISLLNDDQDLLKRMSESGRSFIEKNFSWNKIASDFAVIAKNFLNNRASF